MTNDLHYCLFLHVLPFREHSRESLQQEIEKQESGGEMCQTGFVPIPFKTLNANMFRCRNCHYSCLSSSWETRTTKSIFCLKVETFSKAKSRKLQPKYELFYFIQKIVGTFPPIMTVSDICYSPSKWRRIHRDDGRRLHTSTTIFPIVTAKSSATPMTRTSYYLSEFIAVGTTRYLSQFPLLFVSWPER